MEVYSTRSRYYICHTFHETKRPDSNVSKPGKGQGAGINTKLASYDPSNSNGEYRVDSTAAPNDDEFKDGKQQRRDADFTNDTNKEHNCSAREFDTDNKLVDTECCGTYEEREKIRGKNETESAFKSTSYSNLHQHPLQKVIRFRVLKIDRTDPYSFANMTQDKYEYSRQQLKDMLAAVGHGNRGGVTHVCSAVGIIGAVRFLRGLYIVFATKRELVGKILGHNIYTVTETKILPVANEDWFANNVNYGEANVPTTIDTDKLVDEMGHSLDNASADIKNGDNSNENSAKAFGVFASLNVDRDEGRYRRLLSSIGTRLTKGFYFSPTYPLHRSMQQNVKNGFLRSRDLNDYLDESSSKGASGIATMKNEEIYKSMHKWNREECNNSKIQKDSSKNDGKVNRSKSSSFQGIFTWNAFFAKPFVNAGFGHWVLSLVHGSVSQLRMAVVGFGRVVEVTLLARRSRFFAGTRFRKRGINYEGHVANFVETEQLVEIEGQCRISSFVQIRGSVPLFWSQETSPLSPKPDILLQRFDPLYRATLKHFCFLYEEYGGPIVVLSLLKQNESRPREMILSQELEKVLDFLNSQGKTDVQEYEPENRRIRFVPWDYNKYAKARDRKTVMSKLIAVAATQVEKIGIFVEGTSYHQSGVLRTNCVDCLDRTNVAQYAAGLVAFGRQLHSLGVISTRDLDVGASASRLLMDMYQHIGDDLSLQYGGSESHSAAFKEQRGEWKTVTQSRELLTSIRRFYSNSYSDAEKQDEANLLLGHFIPVTGKLALWDLDNDYYLHQPVSREHGARMQDDSCITYTGFCSQNSLGSSEDVSGPILRVPRVPVTMLYESDVTWNAKDGNDCYRGSLITFFDDVLASPCNKLTEVRLFDTWSRDQTLSTERNISTASTPVQTLVRNSSTLPSDQTLSVPSSQKSDSVSSISKKNFSLLAGVTDSQQFDDFLYRSTSTLDFALYNEGVNLLLQGESTLSSGTYVDYVNRYKSTEILYSNMKDENVKCLKEYKSELLDLSYNNKTDILLESSLDMYTNSSETRKESIASSKFEFNLFYDSISTILQADEGKILSYSSSLDAEKQLRNITIAV